MNTNKMTLGTGSKAKLLAAFAVLAVAFVVLAAVPAVDATDGTDGATPLPDAKDGVITISTSGAYIVKSDTTANIVIADNASVSIDLNGKTIADSGSNTITVNGTLVINDSSENKSGTVDNKSDGKAALSIDEGGTATLNGGTFTRSSEAGTSPENNGGNSYYTIDNYGTLTINAGATVENGDGKTTGKYSSNIHNGYYNGDGKTANPTMTINGGTFKGGLNTIKNDDRGTMTINGGTFTNYTQSCVQNFNILTINGGTFTSNTVGVLNAKINDDMDKGLLTINGGTFTTGSKFVVEQNDAYPNLGNISIKEGVFKGPAVGISAGASVTGGTIAFGNNVVSFKSMTAGSTPISFSEGSVIISGSIDVSSNVEITATGEVELDSVVVSGSTGSLSIETIGSGSEVIVPAGATLEIPTGATLNIASGATLTVAGEVSGSIINNGIVESLNGGNLNGANISGTGKITERSDDSDKENVNIEGIIKGKDNSYDANQIVTITGDTKLDNNAELTINGTLVVKEGVTLTLTAGSVLKLATNAVLDIQGTVVVEEAYDADLGAAKIDVVSGTVSIFGTLDVKGLLNIASGNIVIEQDGILNILSEGTFTAETAAVGISVKASGTVNINGSTGKITIDNAGTVIYNSDVKTENTTINMLNSAVLDIQKVTLVNDGKITVKDAGENRIELKSTIDAGSYTFVGSAYAAAVITGIQVNEVITAATATSAATYNMTVSGNAAVDSAFVSTGSEDGPETINATATITLDGIDANKSGITVADGLVIGKYVNLTNEGKLDVKVGINAVDGSFKNNGTITVTDNGTIVTGKNGIAGTSTSTINAAKYETGTTDSDKRINYVSLDAALAAAANGTTKKIDVLGKQTLTSGADLVSGATLNVDKATVIIGSVDSASDVVLTVKNGATVTGTPAQKDGKSTITVNGTVYAEKKTDLKDTVRTALTNGADVYTEKIDEKDKAVRDGWAKWTNVTSAMNDPEITVVKLTKNLNLASNLTIPEGKTLDTNGFAVNASKNVVITVEGTLYINGASTITLTTVNETAGTDKSASIVVSGLVKSDNEIDIKTIGASSEGITLLGAYYQLDGKYCMTTVEKAAVIISTVDNQKVTIKGESDDKLTIAGDITFSGKSTSEKATVNVELSKITFSGSVSIDNATITFINEATVSGTFSNASGSVALKGKAAAATSVASATTDGAAVLTVIGTLSDVSDTEKQTFTVTGAATVNEITLNYATVDGTLTVKGNSTVSKDLKINGAVSITAGAKLTATSKATVLGTVTAAPATTSPAASAGEFSATILYVGIEENSIYATGAAAVISGNVSISNYALVAPGSEPESLKTSTYKSTEFYKDGSLYITGYAVDETTGLIKDVKVSKDNAYLKGWIAEGETEAVTNEAKIGSIPKVNATFITEIYTVSVITDSAVDNLYLDGNLMIKGDNGQFALGDNVKLKAGSVKFTYTLKNGYTGTGTFKIISDEGGKATINGDTLTLAGTPTSSNRIAVELQLTGFTASGYVDPVTPVTPSEDKDGLTITDYLLIVLVVLIVIMAIIVAMRLMRS